jgi:hypothetical protein
MQHIKDHFDLIKNSAAVSREAVAEFLLKMKEQLSEGSYFEEAFLFQIIEWANSKNALDQLSQALFEYISNDQIKIRTTYLKKYWKIFFSLGLLSQAQVIESQIIKSLLAKKRYQSIIEFSRELLPLGDAFVWRNKADILIEAYERGTIWKIFLEDKINYDDLFQMQAVINDFSVNKKLILENEIILGLLRSREGYGLNKKEKKKMINSFVEYMLRFSESNEIYEMIAHYLTISYSKGIYSWVKRHENHSKIVKSVLFRIDTKKLKHTEVPTESSYDSGADLFSGVFNIQKRQEHKKMHDHYLNRSPSFFLEILEREAESNDDKLIYQWLKSAGTIENENAKDLFVAFLEMGLFKAASQCLEFMKVNKILVNGELYYFTALIKFHIGYWQQCCQECLAALVRIPLSTAEKSAFIVLCARSYHEMGKNNEAASMLKMLEPSMIKGLVKLL